MKKPVKPVKVVPETTKRSDPASAPSRGAGENNFWLQLKDQTRAQIRVVGEYIMEIEYSDYAINGKNQALAAKAAGGGL